MKKIETYVFFDLETTGLIEGKDVPSITELGMLAVKRKHFLETRPDQELRVQHKFRMCFNPHRPLSDKSVELSGLTNELLEQEPELNAEAVDAISSFINCLQKPLCLIAHKGLKYHFPVLKYHLRRIEKQLNISKEVICTDSLYAFCDLLEQEKRGVGENLNEFMRENVTTYEELDRGKYFWTECKPDDSYQLKDIYARECPEAGLEGNRAENHCTMMLKVAHRRAGRFSEWVARNHCFFYQVPDFN
ncbi:hypothetical protein PYW08_012117 [Mythimna loreyi]|uniref:Uncharacterized protein n=1 Tax=Mythimna loreyi TaxID=667449 RepID=A0ACC2Q0I6_9NEOP|nr:hypothetical protein PYW08_012117 [Mythimna loreyi]